MNGSTGRTIAEVAAKERARAAAETTESAAADNALMTLAGKPLTGSVMARA